jgi:hypothetical protein
MPLGKVKFFLPKKGFGFVIGPDEEEFFFHINDLHIFDAVRNCFISNTLWGVPKTGDSVLFCVAPGLEGFKAKPWAFVPNENPSQGRNKRRGGNCRYRVMKQRIYSGCKPDLPQAKWKGANVDSCARKYPRTGDFRTDPLASTNKSQDFEERFWFERDAGNGWAECEDFRPFCRA